MIHQNRRRNPSLLSFIAFLCFYHSLVLHLLLSDPLYLFMLPSACLLLPVKNSPRTIIRFLFLLYLYFLAYCPHIAFPSLFIFTSYCHSSLHVLAIFSPTSAMTEDSSPFPHILSATHWGFPSVSGTIMYIFLFYFRFY